jgi:hypothetical protein
MGRISRSRAATDVVTTTASRWILAATASSRPSRTEFQHSTPTFRPGTLAAAVVHTSSYRASPGMRNASVYDTNAAVTFFATDGKSFVPILSIVPFSIRANVECLAYSSIYVFKHPSSSAGREFINGVLNMGGSGEGEGGGTGNNVAL